MGNICRQFIVLAPVRESAGKEERYLRALGPPEDLALEAEEPAFLLQLSRNTLDRLLVQNTVLWNFFSQFEGILVHDRLLLVKLDGEEVGVETGFRGFLEGHSLRIASREDLVVQCGVHCKLIIQSKDILATYNPNLGL